MMGDSQWKQAANSDYKPQIHDIIGQRKEISVEGSTDERNNQSGYGRP